MFLEKHSRFVRPYDVRLSPRHSGAVFLPLDADNSKYSVRDALESKLGSADAVIATANGDLIELMKASYDTERKCLVLLFHRASPNAAEPTYRRKVLSDAGITVTVRQGKKEADEDQSVSSHLVIYDRPAKPGVYRAALEEIPGLSMSMIQRIVGPALGSYMYDFQRKGKRINTYCVFRPEGLKSESITNALKKGGINFVTLSKPPSAPFVDADGLFQAQREQLRLRVIGDVDAENWSSAFVKMVAGAKKEGWEDFSVDIELENSRKKTVKLDRDDAAKEVLFVRSEEVQFKKELSTCATEIVDEVIENLKKVILSS